MSIFKTGIYFGISLCDVSTGELFVSEVSGDNFCEKVINEIIQQEDLGNPISIGVGVTFDSVIVTKIGIPGSYDVKAFGDCINTASKYSSSVTNQVKVSKKVREEWPKGPNGSIHFTPSTGGDGYILS